MAMLYGVHVALRAISDQKMSSERRACGKLRNDARAIEFHSISHRQHADTPQRSRSRNIPGGTRSPEAQTKPYPFSCNRARLETFADLNCHSQEISGQMEACG